MLVYSHEALERANLTERDHRVEAWRNYLGQKAEGEPAYKMVVVYPCDRVSLLGAVEARTFGTVPVLVGPKERILRAAESCGLTAEVSGIQIIDSGLDFDDNEADPHVLSECKHASEVAAADLAVESAKDPSVEMVMKGSLHSDNYARALIRINKARALPEEQVEGIKSRNSGVFTYFQGTPGEEDMRLFMVTDPSVIVAPTEAEKLSIIKNAIDAMHALGVERPRVAILAATEELNPKNTVTLDAAELAKKCREIFGDQAIFDGPVSFDVALSSTVAGVKKAQSPVAGCADIFVVPEMNGGNFLIKALNLCSGMPYAGLVLSQGLPAILTSRADGDEARENSVLLARAIRAGKRHGKNS